MNHIVREYTNNEYKLINCENKTMLSKNMNKILCSILLMGATSYPMESQVEPQAEPQVSYSYSCLT